MGKRKGLPNIFKIFESHADSASFYLCDSGKVTWLCELLFLQPWSKDSNAQRYFQGVNMTRDLLMLGRHSAKFISMANVLVWILLKNHMVKNESFNGHLYLCQPKSVYLRKRVFIGMQETVDMAVNKDKFIFYCILLDHLPGSQRSWFIFLECKILARVGSGIFNTYFQNEWLTI
jgi:hypothetical protein